MLKKAIFSLIISTLLLFTGCGEKQEIVPKIEIKDGVKFVHNDEPLWGENPQIELKFVRQIGVFEGPDDNYMFFMPNDLTVDKEGNLYVADKGNYRIQKFDKNGKYLATIGRKGVGPSEFTGPVAININSNGNLLVSNFTGMISNHMIMTTEGKELRRFKLYTGKTIIRLLSDDSIIKEISNDDDPSLLLTIIDENEETIRTIGRAEIFDNPSITNSLKMFNYTIDENDNFYISYQKRNLIEKYTSDNKVVLKIDRKVNYDTDFEVSEYKIDRPTVSGGEIVMQKVTSYSVKANSVSHAIAVDGNERIWVVTFNRQQKPEELAGETFSVDGSGVLFRTTGNTDITETNMYILEVFDKEGILLTRFPITHFIDGMRIYGDRLFILDKLRTMCIYEYKIIDL